VGSLLIVQDENTKVNMLKQGWNTSSTQWAGELS